MLGKECSRINQSEGQSQNSDAVVSGGRVDKVHVKEMSFEVLL